MSLRRKLSLAKRGAVNYLGKRPLCISFEITHACNARCKHCHLGGPVKEERASPQRLGELCRTLRPVVAQLSGGEPMLRSDLVPIIKQFSRPNKAPYIVITTNGTLLTRSKYFELREAGVDEISLSLDYPDERHDLFRGVPGLFGKIQTLIRGIDLDKSKAITLCCVVQSDNFRDLPKMATLAQRWGVRLNLSAYTRLRTNNSGYLLSPDDLGEFKKVVTELIAFKKKFRTLYTSDYVFKQMIGYFERGSVPGCRTGERFFNVNPDGTFSPCGLIITRFKTPEELRENFARKNDCSFCYTSIRANTEKPASYAIKDGLRSLR
jgi:MoaA/NifB/PqqE/SkfB family radical SAM enzyme